MLISYYMIVGDDDGMSIMRSTSLVEGLVIEQYQDLFGGFWENVTFFLVIEGRVVKGWYWLDWPF